MFGQLQSSHRRFIDPEPFVVSIKTYDDELINIHNQMDVEEFFNLLNDRWEGLLRSQEAVQSFRSFYGGQLVTQTKSKECEHLSEVMEPFSAIQCDIKGKKDLFESLEAYVDGEHMEGDRSCLKEIPDSLIFHLKRFDFNLRTQARNKINDYFAFPSRIDMRPYTIEHLGDSPGESSDDWFELVGVLVHAGTAESGHYYSYIRERPTSRENENWFEFNDDTVTPWSPSRMEASCYGGSEPSWDANGMSYEKNYCAYMLFYERSSALERKQQNLRQSNSSSPVQARMPEALAENIRRENLRILQRHCLFDPDHVRLVDVAIDQMLDMNSGDCSEDHNTETAAIEMALGHLDQVAARAKDAPGAQKLADRLQEMADNCAHCAFVVYEYFSNRHESFRYLVQRNAEPAIRQSVADLLILALGSIKEAYPENYNAQAVSPIALEKFENNVVHGVCVMFEALWENFHVTFKSWFEVFYLMAKFVDLGKEELLAFLGHNFLEKTILIIVADNLSPQEMDQQFTRLGNTLTRRQNRPPTFATIIELLSNIFASVTNHEATDAIFAHILEQQWSLEEDVLMTLMDNTKAQASFILHAPYLRVAAIYCHVSHNAGNIDRLIKHIAKHSRLLANSEPKAVLGFFKNKAVIDGDRVNSGELKESIELQCLDYLPIWVPGLLAHYDPNVSINVEQVLHEKIFIHGSSPTLDDKYGGQDLADAVVRSAQRVGLQCLQYIHENYIRRGTTVPAQTVTVLQRVLTQCGSYFNDEDDSPGGDIQKFFKFRQVVLDNLRRLSVDDLEDDGSGMSDSESLLSDPESISPVPAPQYQELTFLPGGEEWENSVASSDQMDSLGEDDMNTMDM
ncbi:Ubiquitin carboxyl-terminal hydrolase 34 [Cytospora mali]|uniref:Ubiquitin carboxyl-terminal hydrolase 34 n=1 Tax=Cytospora mali TaxID=578113 RepID=A0A194VFT4_CYTMA|nr:Ubiquitin carboxyl-terminal hydrolase 34 [Valsa mali var. pyri (nom. inval.)]